MANEGGRAPADGGDSDAVTVCPHHGEVTEAEVQVSDSKLEAPTTVESEETVFV